MEVVTMANDDQHHHHHILSSATTSTAAPAFATNSPTIPWDSQSPSPHIYPHSHHGTPAHEYSGFAFPSPQLSSNESSAFQQRPYHQLQPLVMPQWPSMLNHMSHAPYQPPMYPSPVQPVRSMSSGSITPITSASLAPTLSSRSATNPRRTLTDKDRKDMCVYAEEHPNSKQTEIGALFGVERSTVSKVLRQKEKYLQQAEEPGSKSPPKKPKARAPDIERALAVWIKNQQRKGVPITDDLIREKARRFAATTSTPDNHQVLSTSWLEKFKLRHNIMGARSRKSSLAPVDEPESASRSPNDASPISPHQLLSSPVPTSDLHTSQSRERLVGDAHAYVDYAGRHAPHHSQSTGSLNGAFSELTPASPVLFTPDSGSTSGSFAYPRPLFPASDSSSTGLGPGAGYSSSNGQRPRSQTFPVLDQYINHPSDHDPSFMDSPMDEAPDPLLSIDHIVHNQRQHSSTVAPEHTMRPPPLPAHVLASDTAKRDSSRSIPSAADACRAMEIVLEYFAQQPPNFLDMDESVYLGRLMDKVKLRSHSTS